jgi:hypothetical protein
MPGPAGIRRAVPTVDEQLATIHGENQWAELSHPDVTQRMAAKRIKLLWILVSQSPLECLQAPSCTRELYPCRLDFDPVLINPKFDFLFG